MTFVFHAGALFTTGRMSRRWRSPGWWSFWRRSIGKEAWENIGLGTLLGRQRGSSLTILILFIVHVCVCEDRPPPLLGGPRYSHSAHASGQVPPFFLPSFLTNSPPPPLGYIYSHICAYLIPRYLPSLPSSLGSLTPWKLWLLLTSLPTVVKSWFLLPPHFLTQKPILCSPYDT
jgi:hypothetical protein